MISQHYYTVGNAAFADKLEAIEHANYTGQNINWYFNDNVYDRYDWSAEPENTLDELYSKRAREIREEYDYVIVLVSGGADSRNVAYSFLKNGIKIDEIIASVPLSGIGDMQLNTSDTSHNNTVSETTYAQLPLLDDIKREYPQQKITVHDYFYEMTNFKSDIWLQRGGEWMHPSGVARYTFDRLAHIKKIAETGKRIAFVYGIDKPTVVVSEKYSKAYIKFLDLAVNVARPPFDENFPNVDNVMFYWYDDPSIPCKQAHILLNKILKQGDLISKYFARPMKEIPLSMVDMRRLHSKYERAIVPFIYPSTYTKVFQAEKPDNIILGEHDQWLYQKHKNTRMLEMLKSDINNYIQGVRDDLMNPERNGIAACAKWYTIGSINTSM